MGFLLRRRSLLTGTSFLAIGFLATGAGCSFLVSTNGLSGGPPDGAASTPSSSDAGGTIPTGFDAGFAATEGQDGSRLVGTGTEDATADVVAKVEDAEAEDAGADAADAGPQCTATNTPANCSACGVACNTKTGAPSCDGTTCSYACKSGRSDCNQGSAPDTDGCECDTPACCDSGCQTTHADGQGQSFYDCDPGGTYTSSSALAACTAFAKGDAGDCSDNWTCSGDSNNYVCFDTTSNVNDCTTCWAYTGPNAGHVVSCECPWSSIASWN